MLAFAGVQNGLYLRSRRTGRINDIGGYDKWKENYYLHFILKMGVQLKKNMNLNEMSEQEAVTMADTLLELQNELLEEQSKRR